ncbi:MAG: RHS repeat-associated core domain-containing protein, partial [Chitinophagales bacterium]
RQYELTNHLGNVLATIKDEKKQMQLSPGTAIDYFDPIVYTATDYYPFGMPMPNRTYSLSSSKYRFGFNGKENDLEVDGQQDYGFRIYDSRLARFKSVDPLTNKFPMLTPYQFASNTPIQAIDLDGLEAFIVHGTQQKKSGIQLSDAVIKELKRIGGNTQHNSDFRWNSPLYNDEAMRKVSARELAKHVIEQRSIMMSKGLISEKEPITLVGYSHGGNVAIQAVEYIKKELPNVNVNLITISTPAYNETKEVELAPGPGINSVKEITRHNENPADKGIENHTHIYHHFDMIQGVAGGDQYYKNEKTENHGIYREEMPMSNRIEAHTTIYKKEEFVKTLKGIPTMENGN